MLANSAIAAAKSPWARTAFWTVLVAMLVTSFAGVPEITIGVAVLAVGLFVAILGLRALDFETDYRKHRAQYPMPEPPLPQSHIAVDRYEDLAMKAKRSATPEPTKREDSPPQSSGDVFPLLMMAGIGLMAASTVASRAAASEAPSDPSPITPGGGTFDGGGASASYDSGGSSSSFDSGGSSSSGGYFE